MTPIILFFLSFVIRLVGAGQSFWLDEGTSIFLARLPIVNIFETLRGDFHPPLYYLLLHFWLPIAGHSEWAIRLPGIIFGSLCIPILYKFLNELLGKEKKKIALIASMLLLVNPLHIYYSVELRMYSLNALLSLLSWLFLVKWMKKINHKSYAICYLLFSVANLYTFYGAFFNLMSQWFFVVWQHRRKLKTFAICNLLVGLLFLPWLPSFTSQLSGELGNFSFKAIGLIIAKFTLGRITMANKGIYAIFVAGMSLYFLLSSYLVSLTKEGRALLVWFYASLIGAILVSLRVPVLEYWHFVFLLPAFVSIIALGLSVLHGTTNTLNLFVVFLVFSLGNIIFWVTPSLHREDWRQAASLIAKDNSLSIVNFPDVFAPLKFYASGTYFYPDQESLGKIRSDLDQSLPLFLGEKETVFVFDYLSDLSDPKRSILSWLKRAGFKQGKIHNINGVGFIYEFSAPK